jgi:hypothetical protein
MDYIEEKLVTDELRKIHAARPAWGRYKSIDDLRENVVESQLLDAARAIGLLRKAELKALQGLLSKRNECAHPGPYEPGLNESLGYVSELLKRMEQLEAREM